MYVQVQFSAHVNSSKHCSELCRCLPLLTLTRESVWLYYQTSTLFLFSSCALRDSSTDRKYSSCSYNISLEVLWDSPEAPQGVRPLKAEQFVSGDNATPCVARSSELCGPCWFTCCTRWPTSRRLQYWRSTTPTRDAHAFIYTGHTLGMAGADETPA